MKLSVKIDVRWVPLGLSLDSVCLSSLLCVTMADAATSSVGVPGQAASEGTVDVVMVELRCVTMSESALVEAELVAAHDRRQTEKQFMEVMGEMLNLET